MQHKSKFWMLACSTQWPLEKHLSVPLCPRTLPIFLCHHCRSPLWPFKCSLKNWNLHFSQVRKHYQEHSFWKPVPSSQRSLGTIPVDPLHQDTEHFLKSILVEETDMFLFWKKTKCVTVLRTSANQEGGTLLVCTPRQLFPLPENSQGCWGGEIVVIAQQWGIAWEGEPSCLSQMCNATAAKTCLIIHQFEAQVSSAVQ